MFEVEHRLVGKRWNFNYFSLNNTLHMDKAAPNCFLGVRLCVTL